MSRAAPWARGLQAEEDGAGSRPDCVRTVRSPEPRVPEEAQGCRQCCGARSWNGGDWPCSIIRNVVFSPPLWLGAPNPEAFPQ